MHPLFKTVLIFVILNISVCIPNEVEDDDIARTKKHGSDKHFSFHHKLDLGHKVIHKHDDLHIGKEGLSHTKNFHVVKNHPHQQQEENFHENVAHYGKENEFHKKLQSFIDIREEEHGSSKLHGPQYHQPVKGPTGNKVYTFDKHLKVEKYDKNNDFHHHHRNSEDINENFEDFD